MGLNNDFLINYGFPCSLANPSLFVYRSRGHIIILLLFLDDIVLTDDFSLEIHR